MNKKYVLIAVLVVVFIIVGVVIYMFNKSNAKAEPTVVTESTSNGVSNLINQKGFGGILGAFFGK